MDPNTAPDLITLTREVLDDVVYLVLGTVDPDGRARTSPVFFTTEGYRRFFWVSHPDTQHSANLTRDGRAGAVVLDSTGRPGEGRAVYVTGTAAEVAEDRLEEVLPVAFDPDGRGGLRFTAEELVGDADLRLWALDVESWELHVPAGHPRWGTGRDRRVPVDPRT